MGNIKFSKDISVNSSSIAEKLRLKENFDIVKRDITICGKEAFLLFIDGFMKDEISEKLLEFFFTTKDESLVVDADAFAKSCVPYVEVTTYLPSCLLER